MRLVVHFRGCSRPHVERTRLEIQFRDAMLNFCPSVERLAHLSQVRAWDFAHAYRIGLDSITPLTTHRERQLGRFEVRFVQ